MTKFDRKSPVLTNFSHWPGHFQYKPAFCPPCVKPPRDLSLLEGFQSPRTSALLEPLISLKTKEHPTSMADLDPVKHECEKKLMLFKRLLRVHDPSGVDPAAVKEFYKEWDKEVFNAFNSLAEAVDNMILAHKADMSPSVINEWEQNVGESEKKYRDYRAATFDVVKSTRAQAVPEPTASEPASAPAPEIFRSSTQARIAEVKTTIEAERIFEEGKKLDSEIKGYDDWGDASNEEIEEAMRKVEDWNKRLSKIQDRIYSMKENVQLYNLSNVELTKAVGMMEILSEEMNIAIRNIKEEDEARGLYSLSKSKASDVKLPRFSGKPHENFAKFKAEMLTLTRPTSENP